MTNNHCKVVSWGPSGTTSTLPPFLPEQLVNVRCFDRATGVLEDNQFNAVFIHAGNSGQPGSELGYLWANNPTATLPYTPSTQYQYNSSLAVNRVQRLGVGVYHVIFPGLSGTAGTVHATAFGAGSAICNVGFWVPSGPSVPFERTGATVVRVNCYATGGAPVDTQFTVAYVRDMSLASNPNERGAYVWSHHQNTTYTTSSAYQFNTKASSNVLITRLGTGQYRLRLNFMPVSDRTMAMVTAYGSNRHCNVVSLTPSLPFPIDTDVRVNCFAPNGTLADTRLTLSYSSNVPN